MYIRLSLLRLVLLIMAGICVMPPAASAQTWKFADSKACDPWNSGTEFRCLAYSTELPTNVVSIAIADANTNPDDSSITFTYHEFHTQCGVGGGDKAKIHSESFTVTKDKPASISMLSPSVNITCREGFVASCKNAKGTLKNCPSVLAVTLKRYKGNLQ